MNIHKKYEILIIGAGNVATHLAPTLSKLCKVSIFSRSNENILSIIKNTTIKVQNDLIHIDQFDLIILAINDNEISEILKRIPIEKAVAYTSGSISIDELPNREKLGVFYPLQTFSKDKKIDFSNIPFLIEANDETFKNQLFAIAQKISSNVSFANSEERSKIHLAAVFVNNFVNHMVYQSKTFMDQNNLDWSLLQPLLKETVSKLDTQTPYEAQTGPARRGDSFVIQKHIKHLTNDTKEIYTVVSKSIDNTYQKKNDKL